MNKNEKVWHLLEEINFECNAEARKYVSERVQVEPRKINVSRENIAYAEHLGSLPKQTVYYPNAQGGQSKVYSCGLYNLPKNMDNPFLYCFGGVMSAFVPAFEILRFYFKQTGILLPFISSGKEGNKGLFEKVFYRHKGLVRSTEYDSYFRLMALLTGKSYAYQHYEVHNDTDTEGNLRAIYHFAKRRNMKKITLVLCTGNPFYDRRLIAEWTYLLRGEEFKDVEIVLVMAHTPLEYRASSNSIPEDHYSEIFLGYVAASIGPIMKDTISLNGETSTEKPERYMLPGIKSAHWNKVKDIIVNYSNMGWPNYQEVLYGINHKEAVYNVIMSDLYAKASFTAKDYDKIENLVEQYQKFLGGAFDPQTETLEQYLLRTPQMWFY